MNEKRQQKAEYLLSELGGVHDVYLQEALTWKKQRMDWKLPTAIAASVLALLVALPLLWPLIAPDPAGDGVTPPPQGNLGAAEPPMGDASEDQLPSDPTTPMTLDAVLQAATPHSTVTSSDALSYFGDCYLAWQNAGEEGFSRSRALTTAEVDRILYLIRRGEPVGEVSPTPVSRVWLVLGDGTVWTPYLPLTDGNSGAAILFDYNAELLPSSELISCISGILGLNLN